MGEGGQHQDPGALPLGKTRYPSYRRLGGPQCLSARVRNISLPLGFDPRIVQPVKSRYSDWAIPVHTTEVTLFRNSFISSTKRCNISSQSQNYCCPGLEDISILYWPYKGKDTVCSEIHTKQINAMLVPRRILNVKTGGTYSYHKSLIS
jgi:hypothetical protein